MEKRIGVLGNVDRGKSTIIGVIKNNILDTVKLLIPLHMRYLIQSVAKKQNYEN